MLFMFEWFFFNLFTCLILHIPRSRNLGGPKGPFGEFIDNFDSWSLGIHICIDIASCSLFQPVG